MRHAALMATLQKVCCEVVILVGFSTFYHWNKSTFTSLKSKLSFAVHVGYSVFLYSMMTDLRCKECPQLPKHTAGEFVLGEKGSLLLVAQCENLGISLVSGCVRHLS